MSSAYSERAVDIKDEPSLDPFPMLYKLYDKAMYSSLNHLKHHHKVTQMVVKASQSDEGLYISGIPSQVARSVGQYTSTWPETQDR